MDRQYRDEGMRVGKSPDGEKPKGPRKSDVEMFLESAENDTKIAFISEWLPKTKVFKTKGEFEIVVKALEGAMGFLRTLSAEMKIDGLEYKKIDDRLRRLGVRAEEVWKITRWMWLQDIKSSKNKYADLGDKTKWGNVSESVGRAAAASGSMTRVTNGKWEVAE